MQIVLEDNPRRSSEHLGKISVNEQLPALVNAGVILLGVSERL